MTFKNLNRTSLNCVGVHCFGDKRETQTVTQVEHCFIFILRSLWFYMSGHVTEPVRKCAMENAKAKTRAFHGRRREQRPLFKGNMKGRDDFPPPSHGWRVGNGQYFAPKLFGKKKKEATLVLLNWESFWVSPTAFFQFQWNVRGESNIQVFAKCWVWSLCLPCSFLYS